MSERPRGDLNPETKALAVMGVGLGLLVLAPVAVFFLLRSQSPYEIAVEQALASEKVQALLGAPVEASPFFSAKMTFKEEQEVSTLEVQLTGSRQEGTLQAVGLKSNELWGFASLVVVGDDHEQVVVTGSAPSPSTKPGRPR
jgi:hypothetical protein